MRGWIWMFRQFGLRTTFGYWLAYRARVTIDYAEVFNADERAILSEHFTMPWENP